MSNVRFLLICVSNGYIIYKQHHYEHIFQMQKCVFFDTFLIESYYAEMCLFQSISYSMTFLIESYYMTFLNDSCYFPYLLVVILKIDTFSYCFSFLCSCIFSLYFLNTVN